MHKLRFLLPLLVLLLGMVGLSKQGPANPPRKTASMEVHAHRFNSTITKGIKPDNLDVNQPPYRALKGEVAVLIDDCARPSYEYACPLICNKKWDCLEPCIEHYQRNCVDMWHSFVMGIFRPIGDYLYFDRVERILEQMDAVAHHFDPTAAAAAGDETPMIKAVKRRAADNSHDRDDDNTLEGPDFDDPHPIHLCQERCADGFCRKSCPAGSPWSCFEGCLAYCTTLCNGRWQSVVNSVYHILHGYLEFTFTERVLEEMDGVSLPSRPE